MKQEQNCSLAITLEVQKLTTQLENKVDSITNKNIDFFKWNNIFPLKKLGKNYQNMLHVFCGQKNFQSGLVSSSSTTFRTKKAIFSLFCELSMNEKQAFRNNYPTFFDFIKQKVVDQVFQNYQQIKFKGKFALNGKEENENFFSYLIFHLKILYQHIMNDLKNQINKNPQTYINSILHLSGENEENLEEERKMENADRSMKGSFKQKPIKKRNKDTKPKKKTSLPARNSACRHN